VSGREGAVREAAAALASLLAQAEFPLPSADSPDAPQAAVALREQLEEYVLPRLASLDAPLVAVVGGSTGAGKSTLVNSFVGRVVSPSGVLRPTTRHPVLLHHPHDSSWLGPDGLLPGLERVTDLDASSSGSALLLVADDAVPAGLVLLDAPDVDSVVVENRELASTLLDAADLWLFVTSAARYADAVPWALLRQAVAREASTAVVLDRVPAESAAEVAADLGALMQAEGLGESPLLVVPESVLEDGLLPGSAVAPVREWLVTLASDAAAREMVVRATLAGALRATAERTRRVAVAVDEQEHRLGHLSEAATHAYAHAAETVMSSVRDGTLLRTEVLARWRELAGRADLAATLESWVGAVRGRLGWRRPSIPPVAPMEEAITAGLRDVLVDAGDRAARTTATQWRAQGADELLEPGLEASSSTFREQTEQSLREWREGVLELVRTEGGGRRATARGVAAGINGVAVVLIVATFASTGGVTGAEVGIAAAAAVAGQRALETVFGSRAVTRLTDEVRGDLQRRVVRLCDDERGRFLARTHSARVTTGLGTRLREAADRLDAVRDAVRA
jgi:energy-coupling factor transporter ATP-binding protein EcfA2